jgi:hypothetical protein
MASYADKRSFSAVCLANSGCERWRVEAAMETVFWYRRAGEPGHVHTDRILGIKHARLITKARG